MMHAENIPAHLILQPPTLMREFVKPDTGHAPRAMQNAEPGLPWSNADGEIRAVCSG